LIDGEHIILLNVFLSGSRLEFNPFVMAFSIVTDECGIPHSHYGEGTGVRAGVQISPLYVAENGLRAWNAHLRGLHESSVLVSGKWRRVLSNPENDPADRESATRVMMACASWLTDRLVEKNGFAVWEYPYAMSYETPAEWRSAHAQAVALQLLVRANRLERFDDCLNGLVALVDKGGMAEHVAPGAIWFEKFAHPDNQRPKVLNGHLFVIIGLYDIAERLGRDDVWELANQAMEAARLLMPRFDLGDWSAYSILGNRASRHYHKVVVTQLSILSARAAWVQVWHNKFQTYLVD
jgi:hypothetical protein